MTLIGSTAFFLTELWQCPSRSDWSRWHQLRALHYSHTSPMLRWQNSVLSRMQSWVPVGPPPVRIPSIPYRV